MSDENEKDKKEEEETEESEEEKEEEEEEQEDDSDDNEDEDEDEDEEVEVPEEFEDLIEQIESMSVLELSKLVDVLEDKFGVSAAAPAAPAPAQGGGGSQEAGGGGGGQSTFKVMLKDTGSAKIQVIKALKDITGQGLKDAKQMVEELPVEVDSGLEEEEANDIKDQLEEAGATVELQ